MQLKNTVFFIFGKGGPLECVWADAADTHIAAATDPVNPGVPIGDPTADPDWGRADAACLAVFQRALNIVKSNTGAV